MATQLVSMARRALLAFGLGVALLWMAAAAQATAPLKRVLFFSKSSNYEHPVVRWRAGQPSFAEQILLEAGPRLGVVFTFSKDGSLFTPQYLAQFDAVLFYTSGDLLAPGKDGNRPMSAAGKAALLDAVNNGMGFIGTHSATDTFHAGETAATDTSVARTWRYRNLGEQADPYTRMIGGQLIIHGTQQIGKLSVADPSFPGLGKLGPAIELMEEWYSMTNFAPDMHVLLLQETGSMRDPNANGTDWPPAGWDTPYQRPPYPSTWVRRHGKGRVFYTALGHGEAMWRTPVFQDLLFGGISWAVRNIDADITPNLARVAPGAGQLPPVSGPVAGLPRPRLPPTPAPLPTLSP